MRILTSRSIHLTLSLACFVLTCVAASPPERSPNLYKYSLAKPGGVALPLSDYKGKVVVIVNLASKSSFAEQLQALEKLEDKYKDQGLVILGIPSNDFGAEEPGGDVELQKLYATEHVNFPVMAKSSVRGKDELPVYTFLTGAAKSAKTEAKADDTNDVHWSYTKFIVTRDGEVGARFEPDVAPDSPEFEIAVQKALNGKLKPKAADATPEGKGTKAGAAEDDDDGGR